MAHLVEHAQRSPRRALPALSDLVRMASDRQQGWMEWKTVLADAMAPGTAFLSPRAAKKAARVAAKALLRRQRPPSRSDLGRDLQAALLRHTAGLTLREIAEQLGLSLSAIEGALRRHELRMTDVVGYEESVTRALRSAVRTAFPAPCAILYQDQTTTLSCTSGPGSASCESCPLGTPRTRQPARDAVCNESRPRSVLLAEGGPMHPKRNDEPGAWRAIREQFVPADIDRFAGDGEAIAHLIERSQRSPHRSLPAIRDQVRAASHRQRGWMEWKTVLADAMTPGTAFLSPQAARRTARVAARALRKRARLPSRSDLKQDLEAALLRHAAGLTMCEIADALGLSPSALSGALRRHDLRMADVVGHEEYVTRVLRAAVRKAFPPQGRGTHLAIRLGVSGKDTLIVSES